jgi:SAM-dependent methyltransferase
LEPSLLGTKYDRIAQWWHDRHVHSSYGVAQLEKALRFARQGGQALDVGCGAGGRLVRLLQSHRFSVTGLDVSIEMINLAKQNHPDQTFLQQDICTWDTDQRFDLIVAWDSIFHVPFAMQKPVVSKLCSLLAAGGILLYTFGDAHGEHTDQWHDDTFYYSSVGINENLALLIQGGLKVLHLELDQYPENHVYAIAAKL